MGLTVVATPIGHQDDISIRAIELLKAADLIVGEEFKEVSKLLKFLKIEKKELKVLNEHSKDSDVEELCLDCQSKKVILVSDCGTPGFCDPGFQLVKACRKKRISITSAPGPSSLMTLLSLSSERIFDFYFRGFLPAETEARRLSLLHLKNSSEPIIIMDTPYRLLKTLEDLQKHVPIRRLLLGLNLTQNSEMIFEGTAEEVLKQIRTEKIEKAEFILLIYKAKEMLNIKRTTPSKNAEGKKYFQSRNKK